MVFHCIVNNVRLKPWAPPAEVTLAVQLSVLDQNRISDTVSSLCNRGVISYHDTINEINNK